MMRNRETQQNKINTDCFRYKVYNLLDRNHLTVAHHPYFVWKIFVSLLVSWPEIGYLAHTWLILANTPQSNVELTELPKSPIGLARGGGLEPS